MKYFHTSIFCIDATFLCFNFVFFIQKIKLNHFCIQVCLLKSSVISTERSLVYFIFIFSDTSLPYAGYLFVCTIHYKNTQTSRTRSSSHFDAPPFDVIISIAHAMKTEDMSAFFS